MKLSSYAHLLTPGNLPCLRIVTPQAASLLAAAADHKKPAVDVRARRPRFDPGMRRPPDDLARIFDRFYRVKGKTRGITGSGLGLSVAKSIVEAHRGTIEVQSEEKKGSTFSIILPVQV